MIQTALLCHFCYSPLPGKVLISRSFEKHRGEAMALRG